MKRYPIGIQDFSVLREGNYLYVDKTAQMYQLVEEGKYFFLSRPRRFGKSLLLSTLKYYFLGRRELFKGLWIDQEGKSDWLEHPVLHFSLSSIGYKDLGLENALLEEINSKAAQYGITLASRGLSKRFQELIQKLGEGPQQVVLLIDEYDKPLVDYIEELSQAETNREVMKNLFSGVKDSDPYLRFLFITGVSKFSKVSLFSDLNHLNDITLHPRHATLTGYTPDEMEYYFGDQYGELAEANQMSQDEVVKAVQSWYNGYQWDMGNVVYNPFSVLNLFDSGRFANYWWETGTPTFLIKLLRQNFAYDLTELQAGSTLFDSYTLENMDWRSLLFQTGYLTIHAYDPRLDVYTLGYPNREVKDAMFQYLLGGYRYGSPVDTKPLYANIYRALEAQDFPRLMEWIDVLFATIPHQIFDSKREGFFHAVLHLTFQGLGLLTQSEVSTAKGRVDTLVQVKNQIYVMEFKLDAPAAEALAQIKAKRYGSAYLHGELAVIAVGISFSSESRSVAEWEAVAYQELLAD